MGNTAIEEFIRGYKLKSWLFLKTWNKVSVHGKTDIELAMKYYTEQLQAKHEEKLKQAVIKTYLYNQDYCDDLTEVEAELYYEENFNTKEL
jgi:hypothetical protein